MPSGTKDLEGTWQAGLEQVHLTPHCQDATKHHVVTNSTMDPSAKLLKVPLENSFVQCSITMIDGGMCDVFSNH